MGDDAPSEPAWGTPPQPSRLLTADAFAVIERSGFMTGRSYELVAMDGSALGHLSEQTSAGNWLFRSAAASTFTLRDASGVVIATMHRPGSLGRFRFLVSDRADREMGTVEQENTFLAPQFELRSVSGQIMRLAGGSFGSTDWELVDAADESVVGRVTQEFSRISGIFGGTQRFAVRLSPVLAGESRLLAVMTTACLDYVRDAKKRRSR